ncbi:MAG TPA: Calx-beta domain-containing protein [bacterium]|nr:Calx-beta domain-containing protein [bacterium]
MKKNLPALLIAGLLTVQTAQAANITVNSTADDVSNDGECTLREAIASANTNAASGGAPGECAAGTVAPDAIAFGIGSGQKTIALSAAYADVLSDVTIDATTQPGFSGQPLIELNGQNTATSGFLIVGDNVTVKGFVINRFASSGIAVSSGADQSTIQGNYIGVDPSGTVDQGNGASGIECAGCADGLIGGTGAGEGNLVSGNATFGIFVLGAGAQGNSIVGNRIGTNAAGTASLPNDRSGILINNGAQDNLVEGNLISGNTESGVEMSSLATQRNAILSNAITNNGGLGISIGAPVNDNGDVDTGTNNLQNFPVLTSAVSAGGQTKIQGTLNSTASASGYRIEFFSNDSCDDSGQGEGEVFLGAVTGVNTNGSGNASFTADLSVSVPSGQAITATATDPDSNTSEFSACLTSVAPGSLGFGDAAFAANEADGHVTITVTRTGGSDGAVSVDYATGDGTATDGGDYTGASGTLNFADGETSKTFEIPLLNDANFEGSETVDLTLSHAQGGAALGVSEAALTIADDETCGNGAVDSGEECDDGNAADGDGCNASCQTESGNGGTSGTAGTNSGGNASGGCSLLPH